MGAQSPQRNQQVFHIPLGSPSTDAAIVPGAYLDLLRKFHVESAHLINGDNLAASDTDYVILELKNGSTVVAELDTRAAHEGALTAHTPKALNVVSGQEEQEGTLTVNYNETDAGTNVALTAAVLVVRGWWKQTA